LCKSVFSLMCVFIHVPPSYYGGRCIFFGAGSCRCMNFWSSKNKTKQIVCRRVLLAARFCYTRELPVFGGRILHPQRVVVFACLLACSYLLLACLLLACSYHSVPDRRKGPLLSCTEKVPYICFSPLPVTETHQFRPILGTRRSPTVRTLPPGSVRSIWNLRISAITWRSYTVSFFPTTVFNFLLRLKKIFFRYFADFSSYVFCFEMEKMQIFQK